MQSTIRNAQLACHLRLGFATPLHQLHRFQFEFLGKGPLFLWHAGLPSETLFQAYLLRKSRSRPRVQNVETWIRRLMRWCPIGSISYEAVRFDTQALQNPEIEG